MQALSRQRPGMSTLSVVRQMYADQGLGGFFKGLAPSMIMVINPTIQYILYESLVARALEWQRNSRAARGQLRHGAGAAAAAPQRHAGAAAAGSKGGGMALGALDIFVLSALAKIGATLVTYPLLVVKNRLQVGL
jgi:adenine nucleotide transporter 17